jgi:quinolinate synthase
MIEAPEVQPLPIDRLRMRKGMSTTEAAPLSREIMALKKELNAVILAHN